jgi:AcrR family transcriptional regulator
MAMKGRHDSCNYAFLNGSGCGTFRGMSVSAPRPSTRPRLYPEFIEEHRRRRYVDAPAEILHEFGRRGLTTTNLVRVAGGARGSFYEVFSGVEDCIAYGIGVAEAQLFTALDDQSGEESWLLELDEAIGAFFTAVASRPLLAELFLIHSAASRTDAGRAAFRSGPERFVPFLRQGRAESEALDRRPPPSLIEECLSRTIVSFAARRVQGPDIEALPTEIRAMTLLAGGFYLGREEAEATLARGAGRTSSSSSRATSSPL